MEDIFGPISILLWLDTTQQCKEDEAARRRERQVEKVGGGLEPG